MASLVAALVAIVMAATPALGDTEISQWGRVGAHRLRDTDAHPGAWCGYGPGDEGWDLELVAVKSPIMLARDRSAARDGQRVGWRVIVNARPMSGAPGRVLLVTPIQRARAWDDTAADFTRMVVPLSLGATKDNPDGPNVYIRVKVQMIWYRPGDPSRVAGWAKHRVDAYLITTVGRAVWRDCPGWGYVG
jgi:hypothetical protein